MMCKIDFIFVKCEGPSSLDTSIHASSGSCVFFADGEECFYLNREIISSSLRP